VHKADLSIYRLVSDYPPLAQAPSGESASKSTVPPLLIAFILDTNDIPAGQTLMWNRDEQRVALDPCLVHNPAQGARKPGIVLERWTFRVT
jgi:autophagy-related protein 13